MIPTPMSFRPSAVRSRVTGDSRGCRPAIVAAVLLRLCQPARADEENHAAARFESYKEEHDRIHVDTVSALFDKTLSETLKVKGEFVYDSISGATPTGGPATATEPVDSA